MNGLINRIALLAIFLSSFILKIEGQNNFRIMFYNVENMYDTKDNPKTHDDDLTPNGQLRWSNYRYWIKLNNISKVISSVGNQRPPALIGICEVENDSVLYDLTKRAALRKDKYEFIITNSKDARGSNVALLYQRDEIKIISKKIYRPVIETAFYRTTRDVLHVTGRIINGELLDIFVCHFPSRNEGIKKTRPYRIKCAELIKQKADSLLRIRKNANIIIMGDFNDYPDDISIKETLKAQSLKSDISNKNLYNMYYEKALAKSGGTYKYRGKWNYLDQFIVSGNLLKDTSKTKIKGKEAFIFSSEYLLHDDSKKYGGQKPFRTYLGFKYLGGYSDHLPIYMDLQIKN